MARSVGSQNSFTSGEIGAKIRARKNLEEYQNSVEYLSNFNPQNTGGVKFREGTRSLLELPYNGMRLIPFIFSRTEAYAVAIVLRRGLNVESTENLKVYDISGNSQHVVGLENSSQYIDLDPQGFHYTQRNDVLVIVHSSGQIPPIFCVRTLSSGTGAFQFNFYFSTEAAAKDKIPSYLNFLNTPYNALADFKINISTKGNVGTVTGNYTYIEVLERYFGRNTLDDSYDPITLVTTNAGSASIDTIEYPRFREKTDQPSSWDMVDINVGISQVVFHENANLTDSILLLQLKQGLSRNDRVNNYFSKNTIQTTYGTPYTGVLPLVSFFYYEESHENISNGDSYDPIGLENGWYIRSSTTEKLTDYGVSEINLVNDDTDEVLLTLKLRDFKREKFKFYLYDKITVGGEDAFRYERTENYVTDDNELLQLGFIQYRNTAPKIDLSGINVRTEMIKDSIYSNEYTRAIFKNDTNEMYVKMINEQGVIKYEVEQQVTGTDATGDYDVFVSQWNPKQEFPRTITQFQERFVYGGNTGATDTVWVSTTSDVFRLHYFKFKTTPDGLPDLTTDLLLSSAFSFKPASSEVNIIQWLSSGEVLSIGTTQGEFITSKVNDEFSPVSKTIKKQSAIGGSRAQAVLADNATYFVGREGKNINEFTYVDSNGQFRAINLNLLNPDIVESGAKQLGIERSIVRIQQIVWQNTRKILWALNNIGRLFGIVLDVGSGVTAFFRFDLGSFAGYTIDSIAVLPNLGGNSDDLYLTIKRNNSTSIDINTGSKNYIEYLPLVYDKENIVFTETSFFFDEEACFLDAAIKKIISPITQLTISQGGILDNMEFINGTN